MVNFERERDFQPNISGPVGSDPRSPIYKSRERKSIKNSKNKNEMAI
jgi:hypothetical protein